MQQGNMTVDAIELRAIQTSEAALFLAEGCARLKIASAVVHNRQTQGEVKAFFRPLLETLEFEFTARYNQPKPRHVLALQSILYCHSVSSDRLLVCAPHIY